MISCMIISFFWCYLHTVFFAMFQNSVNKSSKNMQQRSDGKKKSGSKSSPWKKSLSQFLRRKRPCSRLPTNNNNNDCTPANQTQSAHNGHAPNSPSNKADNLPLPDEWLNSVESENVWNLSPAPVPNNVSGENEQR